MCLCVSLPCIGKPNKPELQAENIVRKAARVNVPQDIKIIGLTRDWRSLLYCIKSEFLCVRESE